MRLFYQKNIDLNQKNFTLNEIDSKHAIKVLRLKKDDIINVMDGIGNFLGAAIENTTSI